MALFFFYGRKSNVKKGIKKIEKLNADKIKFIDEQSKIQKKINDIEIEIKDYTAIKRDYEKNRKRNLQNLQNLKR